MRTIAVSTEVFAEIWKRHHEGDESEDAVLRRVFKLPPAPRERMAAPPHGKGAGAQGYVDDRHGVSVPEGFEIFRVYKGKEIRARATGGHWLLLTDNTPHPSLNKLSWAVVKGSENAWHNWKYMDGTSEQFIHSLRDPNKVAGRPVSRL
jgi:hypothetical protein